MIVAKLGGSLAEAGDRGATLRAWLAALAACGEPAVVVPGGGPFAEAVRAAQPALGLSDAAADRMALLAMEQFGHALRDLSPACETAASEAAIAAALRRGRLAVWLPSRMALADAALPRSWDVTSDSLAAWLAARLAASRLVLVKSAPPPPGGPDGWAAAGYVDAAFPRFAARLACPVQCLGPGEAARLPRVAAAA